MNPWHFGAWKVWNNQGHKSFYIPENTKIIPQKRDYFNRNYIFQPLIFRGHSFVFRGIYATRLEKGMQRRLGFGSKTNDQGPWLPKNHVWDLTISHVVLSYAHTRTISWDWYIYLNLVVFYGKCKLYHTWILWDMKSCLTKRWSLWAALLSFRLKGTWFEKQESREEQNWDLMLGWLNKKQWAVT